MSSSHFMPLIIFSIEFYILEHFHSWSDIWGHQEHGQSYHARYYVALYISNFPPSHLNNNYRMDLYNKKSFDNNKRNVLPKYFSAFEQKCCCGCFYLLLLILFYCYVSFNHNYLIVFHMKGVAQCNQCMQCNNACYVTLRSICPNLGCFSKVKIYNLWFPQITQSRKCNYLYISICKTLCSMCKQTQLMSDQ